MRRGLRRGIWGGAGLLVLAGAGGLLIWRPAGDDPWSLLEATGGFEPLALAHPLAGTVMPGNMPAPVVAWGADSGGADDWLIGFRAGGRRWLYAGVKPPWRMPEADWQEVKAAANGGRIETRVAGRLRSHPGVIRTLGKVGFTVTGEALESPVFFREVILPFAEAVKDPSRLRWRFGGIDRGEPPPVVLENLPVCGNCHSFSRDGGVLAMDIDYANSKGSYVITTVAPQMQLLTNDIITWDDYRREDGQQTFGLLSQISPDGRYVLSTVKDRSVFVPKPDLAFSQLFFPLKGIVAYYDRERQEFQALPGADDPALVQSNPTWSPDGQWVVFARTQAYELKRLQGKGKVLLSPEECEEFLRDGKEFRYDLYRVPFNGGRGGRPEPLRGASGNGRSNFFPRYSPDGRWIVFCQADKYMLLQPDSELFIIPAEGGEVRKLACNLGRMNSWHSWSPDGRWLVFSSKAHSDYTQLYLTRIDERGEASPAVWLAHMVAPERAVNIPEFVPLRSGAIARITAAFLDDYSYTRAGNEFYRAGEPDRAVEQYRTALLLNPDNAMAHQRLGFLLFNVKHQPLEGLMHSRRAVALEPDNPFAQYDLGMALMNQGDLTNAVKHLAEAVRLLPEGYDSQYHAVDMHYRLGETCYQVGRYAECRAALLRVIQLRPNHAEANFMLAMALAQQGAVTETAAYYQRAIEAKPPLARLPDYHDLLSRNQLAQGNPREALVAAETAYRLAVEYGREQQAARLQRRIEECRRAIESPGG